MSADDSWPCPLHPGGHKWNTRLRCSLCGVERSASDAIVSGLSSARGWDRADAERVRDAHRAEVLRGAADELLPVWEAMYEPGNVSDYLIGYTNGEAAAKGAALAWLHSEGEFDDARLEWVEQRPGDHHDRWFDLIENHDDGIPTGTGINVRRRLAASSPRTARGETCGSCRQPFDPSDTRFDGHARSGNTPYCHSCVDRCHESTDAFHVCAVCRSNAEGGDPR